MKTQPSPREMEKAVLGRDASYDGIFFVAVRTTSIFCRPSCPARKPKRENMVFYPAAKEALFAGYRPCKRCRPLAVGGAPPEWAARLLEAVETAPQDRLRDADLRTLGVDPARARRFFKQQYGLTFQAYCRSRRLGQALRQIREGTSLDDVILGHGYDSHSGFREAFGKTFGQPPGKGRQVDCIVTALMESDLGPLLMGATQDGVCLLEFSDRRQLETQVATLRKRFRCAVVPGQSEHLEQLQTELAEYFAGKRRTFDVKLAYPGSPFQQKVWAALLGIPYGETRSYDDIAGAIGSPGACRAVGRANGSNRICIIIPCHRVINKSGQLGGYGGGLWRKQWLLDLERKFS